MTLSHITLRFKACLAHQQILYGSLEMKCDHPAVAGQAYSGQGFRNWGAGGPMPPPRFLPISLPYLNQEDSFCSPCYDLPPRIFRPSYGPAGNIVQGKDTLWDRHRCKNSIFHRGLLSVVRAKTKQVKHCKHCSNMENCLWTKIKYFVTSLKRLILLS